MLAAGLAWSAMTRMTHLGNDEVRWHQVRSDRAASKLRCARNVALSSEYLRPAMMRIASMLRMSPMHAIAMASLFAPIMQTTIVNAASTTINILKRYT
jgi:hypothetical protein